jgi:hypothetical protein
MQLGCEYDKHGKAFNYELCKQGQEAATERANKLRGDSDETVPLLGRNPWASVQDLFRELRVASGT